MHREIVIKVSDGDSSFMYPDIVEPNYVGFGSSSRSLSGKPFEIVRGKRLDSVSISFNSLSNESYEFLLYLWQYNISFQLISAIPQISETNCFISLNGFNLKKSLLDSYSGSIEIMIP